MSFFELLQSLDITSILEKARVTNSKDVEAVLSKQTRTISDFPVLISKIAANYLEEMANLSQKITLQRFGRAIQLYVPLYISNYCENHCVYCGFNISKKTKRVVLTEDEILKEAFILKDKGFRHILILTGEAGQKTGKDFIKNTIKILAPHFSSIGLEVYPMDTDAYTDLINEGADSLTIYQETYNQSIYQKNHPRGPKRDYRYRLETPDRAGMAGFYRVSVGALLGLYNWQYEAIVLAYHLNYLQKNYWQTKFAVSLPRIRDNSGGFSAPYPVSDENLVQFICAFRLVFPDLGINLSTRESAELRDNLVKIGVTTVSAESGTAPGCYSGQRQEEQFSVADARSLNEVSFMLKKSGYDVVMKDWF